MKKLLLLVLILDSCLNIHAQLPAADPYPFQPPAFVITQAKKISDSLEAYIYKWTLGQAPSTVPSSLIPQGITDSKNFYLKNPNSVTPQETWAVRYAKPLNKDSLYTGIPDPKITYLFLGTAFAPFGSKLVIEGEFPHCRFFSFQISPPLNGEQYYAQRVFGTAEVSIADVDIDPLPGHTNPFRVGASRNATNRSYKMEFDLTTGDPTVLNGTGHIYPYRSNSNVRKGAMMVYQGPLGHKTLLGTPLVNGGDWDLGCLWIRIYEPDENVNALGGVPMPKVYFELPNGSKYFIGSDFSRLQRRADTTIANRVVVSQPNPNFGPTHGWGKSFGITLSILNGICQATNWTYLKDSIRKIELGWTGRGENQPAPGDIEPHATTNNYASYVGRPITVPPGMVAVLTGKLPTFPSTKNGESIMNAAQVRYWSIIGIDQDPFSPLPATTAHAITDDEVSIDANRNYVIAYSRMVDKPNNASTANGVSWVDWGTQSDLGVLMRWVCVAPDWYFPLAPHENNIDYKHSSWSSPSYDSTLLGVNWRNGFMKCYLPRVHYMTKAEFEALGSNLDAEKIPIWVDSSYTRNGAAESRLGTISASGALDANAVNAPSNVNDGNMASAWSAAWNTPNSWITVDLGSMKKISAVKLNWDWILFAKDYTLKTSNDNITWTTIATAVNENGQVDLYKNLQNISGRYVKLDLTAFNALYYRLGEFEVYTSDCNCSAPGPIASINQNSKTENIVMSVYPNPTSDNLFISINKPDNTETQYYIYNIEGKIVSSMALNTTQNKIDVSNLSNGIYCIVAINKNWNATTKFIKAK
jgi:hypothetical protein